MQTHGVSVDGVSNMRRPAPPPLEANDQLVTAVITGGWVIALIVLLAIRSEIPPGDRWWIWTCVTGVGLGVFGLLYTPHLKRSRERAARLVIPESDPKRCGAGLRGLSLSLGGSTAESSRRGGVRCRIVEGVGPDG